MRFSGSVGSWRRRQQSWLRLALLALSMLMGLTLTQGAVANSASKTVLVLGDSLSAEYGLVRGTGWVPLIEKKLAQEKIPATLLNASISGETTSGGRTRLPSLLDKNHPDIIVIELGANDGLRGLPLKATEDNLRAMIMAAQKAKARVLLVGMQIPPNYGPDYTKRFAQLYADLAKQYKTALVPFLFANMSDKPELFQSDRIHPTAAAQPILMENVWSQLKPMLTSHR